MPRGVYKRTKEYKAKLSVSLKKHWADPENYAKRCAIQKVAQNRPEVQAKRSATLKEVLNRPEIKEKHRASAKAAHARPEYIAKQSVAQKIAQNRPEVKEKHRASAIIMQNRPKTKEAKRTRMMGDENPMRRPEVRAKFSGENNPMKRPEVKIKISGENSYLWKGGIGHLPYPFEFNKELKESIRERDNNTCQLCGKTKEENGKNLAVHHIDYVKENLDTNNLLTLCNSCNPKVNVRREFWTEFFALKLDIKNCFGI